MHDIALTLGLLAGVISAPAQIITTFVGTEFTFPTQPIPAAGAPVGTLTDAASDSKGNLYVLDSDNSLVLKVSPAGVLTVVAGNGKFGFSGDGGPATAASLYAPEGIAVDAAGNIYIADDFNSRIRKVSGGIITTVAGNGNPLFAGGATGDGGPATAAPLGQPFSVAVDSVGTLYIAERNPSRIRKVSGGIITTVAGNGIAGFSGDGGLATQAQLNFPGYVALDPAGNLYISDRRNHRIRKVTGGIINTIAGSGTAGFSGDGGPAIKAAFDAPSGLAFDSAGNLYIADSLNNRIRKVSNGIVTTVAGNGVAGFSGDGGDALSASLNTPGAVVTDLAGNLLITDMDNGRVRRMNLKSGIIDTFAGGGAFRFSGDGGSAAAADLSIDGGVGLALDASGALYIADSGNSRVRKVVNGIIQTIAGNGSTSLNQANGPALSTPLDFPLGVAVDTSGAVYIANGTSVVKLAGGTVTKVPGLPDASSTPIPFPLYQGIAADALGNVYVSDNAHHVVYKIAGGTVSIFAGTYNQRGSSGNGGPATSAMLRSPAGLAVDAVGNVYIADSANSQVREVSGGIINVFAGVLGGGDLPAGDGGPAINATLSGPSAVAVDSAGSVYIADSDFNTVRQVTNGVITTIVGNGVAGFSGDGASPLAASLFAPQALAVDSTGSLYIGDSNNNRIRLVSKSAVSFQASPLSLSFTGTSGGAATGARPVNLSSNVAGLSYKITSSASWLIVNVTTGTIPAAVQVTADPLQLAPGTYNATLTIEVPSATPSTATIAASFSVSVAAAGKLSVSALSQSFAATTGTSPTTAQLTVSNQGGGAIVFAASVSTSSGGNWLQVAPGRGTVTATTPATLTLTATPGTLGAGTYTGSVSITSADTGQQFSVSVTLALKEPLRKILLSQTGLTFIAVAQGGAPLSQSFGILNVGQASMDWTASATTLSSGSGWLSIDVSSGTVSTPFLDVSIVNVSVDPSQLAQGDYYGQIQVRATGASNSPQTVSVVLSVLPPGSNPGPELRPTGLIFTGAAGVTPGSQDVRIGNPTGRATEYLSGSIGTGFSFVPSNALVQPNQPTVLRVYPDFSKLTSASILRGTITLQFSDGTPRNVSVLVVVAAANSAGPTNSAAAAPLATSCVPTKLLPIFAQLGSTFSVPAGWPVAVIARIVDDCGAPMTSGSVVASFSNGDPPFSLIGLQDGSWSGSWQPRNSTAGTVVVTIEASIPEKNLKGMTQSSIGLQGSKTLPVLSSGPLSAVTLTEGPLSPGELVLIKGSGLANGQATATGAPGQELAGASVVVGGRLASLLYADSTQVLGLIPSDLPVNTSQQILVQRGDNLGLPAPVIISTTHPSVLTQDGSGAGQAAIYNSDNSVATVLADTSNPAHPGDAVIIYCTGLGLTDQNGLASNQPGVSIGGLPAQVSYAGIALPVSYPQSGAPKLLGGRAPLGFGGLYQINAIVPTGVVSGQNAVTLVSAGQSSQSAVTLAIAGAGPNVPVIRSINTAGGFPDIAQNAWIEIKGSNLSHPDVGPNGLLWDSVAIAASGVLPTALNGVTATVNGQPAFVYFISPSQVDVLTPIDSTTGSVQVVLTNRGVSSTAFSTTLRAAAPSFPLIGTTHYVAATDGRFFVGPSSLSAPGFPFLPAQTGDTIVVYGFGFGLPVTPVQNGSSSQAGALPVLPKCQIGGVDAVVLFAGLSPGSVGLYQLNMTVPGTAAIGDNAISCTYAGQTTPAGDLIAVQR